MTNAYISPKAKALLSDRVASAKVSLAIAERGAELAEKGSIEVNVGNRIITVRVPGVYRL